MRRAIRWSLLFVGPVALAVGMYVSLAHAATSVTRDASGDAGSPLPYLDVRHAYVMEQRGTDTLLFMMLLAGPIPKQPSQGDLIWPFHVDTDRGTSPGGLYNEYVVRVRWVTGAFVGQVVDRTPLLTPGAPTSPTLTSIPFRIEGRTVKAFVPRELLGNPVAFGWNAATRPGATVPYVDFAPNARDQFDSRNLATWTS